jgi:hypothetical protein
MMYNRFVELRFVKSGYKLGGANFFNGNDIERPLHIEGTCSMKSDSKPNDAEITIYNLSQDTARKVLVEKEEIEIWAGYKPQNGQEYIGLIFKGVIRSAITNREGVNRKTVVHIGDGDKAHKNAKVTKKVPKGKYKGQVDAAVEAMANFGVVRGDIKIDDKLEVGRTVTFNNDSARQVLDDVAYSTDSVWMITEGKIHFHKRDETLKDLKYVITPDNGLLGSPVFSDDGVAIRTLLIHDLRPSFKINVKSNIVGNAKINGSYKIEEINFDFSNGTGSHGCNIRLKEIGKDGKVKRKKSKTIGKT